MQVVINFSRMQEKSLILYTAKETTAKCCLVLTEGDQFRVLSLATSYYFKDNAVVTRVCISTAFKSFICLRLI